MGLAKSAENPGAALLKIGYQLILLVADILY
jgi:hypothetical protein